MRYKLYLSFCEYEKKAPAFLFALFFLFGIAFALTKNPLFIVFSLIICAIFFVDRYHRKYRKSLLLLLTALIACIYGFFIDKRRGTIECEQQGLCHFVICDMKLQKTPFKNHYVYKGTLKRFVSDEGKTYYNMPCTLRPPKGKDRPKPCCDFSFRCKVIPGKGKSPIVETIGAWEKIENTYSFAEVRHHTKERFRRWVLKMIPNKKGAGFLFSLCYGEIDSQLMEHDFSRLGLQHILAVSGFHFGLISLFASVILRLFLPTKGASFILMILLTFYFFLLSSAPSILRAYLASMITLIGAFIERKPKALNTLGLTLIIELLIEPYHLFHIGFQLSFLCTAALITISPSLGRSLSALFPKIESDALKNLSLLQKIGYLISTYIKTALTACLAVHLVTIPVCLYYSGSFPLFSLIYNLFFPLLAMVCMCIFLTGLLMMIIPPIGSYLLIFSGKLTALALKITEHPPLKVEWHLYLKNISSTKLVLYLFFIFLFVSWKRQKDQYGSLLSCHSLNKKQRNS